MVNIEDGICPEAMLEYVYHQIGASEKHYELLRGGHIYPAIIQDDSYIRRMT